MELRFEKKQAGNSSSSKTASSNSVMAQRSLSGGHRRVGRWASLRRHKPHPDDDDVEDDDELVMHVPGGQRGGAIHGSLRHFKSIPSNSPSPASRTAARSDKVKKTKNDPPEAKVDKRAKPNKTATKKASKTKAKEAETETEDEEPARVRVVRAFGLSRSGKHKVSSDLVPPSSTSGSHSSIGTSGSKDQERAAPYYCVVQVTPVEMKGQPPVRTPPTKKTPPLLRTTLEGRLCNYVRSLLTTTRLLFSTTTTTPSTFSTLARA